MNISCENDYVDASWISSDKKIFYQGCYAGLELPGGEIYEFFSNISEENPCSFDNKQEMLELDNKYKLADPDYYKGGDIPLLLGLHCI